MQTGNVAHTIETVKRLRQEIESLKSTLRGMDEIGEMEREIIDELEADNERLKRELEELRASFTDAISLNLQTLAQKASLQNTTRMAVTGIEDWKSRAQQAEAKLAEVRGDLYEKAFESEVFQKQKAILDETKAKLSATEQERDRYKWWAELACEQCKSKKYCHDCEDCGVRQSLKGGKS